MLWYFQKDKTVINSFIVTFTLASIHVIFLNYLTPFRNIENSHTLLQKLFLKLKFIKWCEVSGFMHCFGWDVQYDCVSVCGQWFAPLKEYCLILATEYHSISNHWICIVIAIKTVH